MTTTTRQNNLILNEDWTRIYQTFKNADFKSYDFENIRRVMIEYIRENYPEDFNDYIESSEYLALIDAIAFMGQSLSFRIDLASRENFIELAETKESVLRLARMISYNSKRNIPSTGLLKFDTVSTTEDIVDSNGRNLAQQVIIWNDATNSNWNEQFLKVLNSAMADNTEFGRSQGSAVIQGIATDQYRFRTFSRDVPVFSFAKSVAGRSMVFELVSTSFKNSEEIYEEDPFPGNQLGFVYKNDKKGPASANNGFFLLFKQGSLEVADFSIDVPTANEILSIDAEGINNDDVWLYSLNSNGTQQGKWSQVPSLAGNNIAYNSLVNGDRNIYGVITKDNDKVDLIFADGTYGNLPQGSFRTYYRTSNGIGYSIAPSELRGISIDVPYLNKRGAPHVLSITMSLKYTVSSSSASEDIDSIRAKAPAQYYTQNRMITGEDYNLAPLTSSQNLLKIKAINRISSGISRNFDIVDASGKYSSVDVFADDGILYKNEKETSLEFKFTSRVEVYNFIRETLEPYFSKSDTYNFYLTKYSKILFIDQNTRWFNVTSDTNLSTGYFFNEIDPTTILKAGAYTNNTLKYLGVNSLIKFIPISGYVFDTNNNMVLSSTIPENQQKTYIWSKVVKVQDDGTNAGRGVLKTGLGPIFLTEVIPAGAIAEQIIPKFVSNLSDTLENQITNLVFANSNFGLRYDNIEAAWKIINASNINTIDDFSLGKTGDLSGSNLDASWMILFTKDVNRYIVKIRTLEFIFGSVRKNRFYFDPNETVYDSRTNRTIKDVVNVLGINAGPNSANALNTNITFEISDSITYEDGYTSTNEIRVSLADSDADGVVDNPNQFINVVGEDNPLGYIFFEKIRDLSGSDTFVYLDNSQDTIMLAEKETAVTTTSYADGQLVYFYSVEEAVVKQVNRSTNTFNINNNYRANIGRAGLKFQYIHNASVDRRIDPSVSNIIDIYMVTVGYNTDFRNWLSGAAATRPTPPTTDSLRISFGGDLNAIKSISDEIIYHPAEYRILFGKYAEAQFQATFKIVKNSTSILNDNDLKVKVINAIDTFFDINNWDFGDRFYVSELTTYVINTVAPDISNIAMVPLQPSQAFGSLFEIQCSQSEIFVSGATVDNVNIVTALSASELNINPTQIVSTTV